MKLFVSGGAVLAALFTAPAISQIASPTSLTSPTPHARRGGFTANQNRSDVPTRIERMFKKLDSNHDGFITKDEVASLQSQFEQRATKNEPKRAARMFDRLDTNHDGQVTQAEADAARLGRSSTSGKRKRAPSSLFAKADANKDGIVTRAEFDAATIAGKIKVRHASMRGSAIVRLFDTADLNKDGRLSLAEAQAAALKQFDAADANHDGVLSPDERRQALKGERAKRRAA